LRDVESKTTASISKVGSELSASIAILHKEVSDLKDAVQNLLIIATIVLVIAVIAAALSAIAIIRQRKTS
ncbi:MAG: hypothetical protein QXW02_02625, partial [Nitrososphaerota archaeon]